MNKPETTCAYKLENGEECGRDTNESFGFGSGIYYFCAEHKGELFKQVTGKWPKPAPKPKV
jgi:hypothetical protein